MKRMTNVFDSWTGYDTKKLDFDVVEKPLTVDTPAGVFTVPDRKSIFRETEDGLKYLATVSSNYPVIKHSEIITRIENGMNLSDAKVETILSKNGAVMQRMYTLPKINAEIKKGDIIAPVIRIVNSYNGNTSVGFYMDALRLVCTNGMVSTKEFMSMQYRHFGNVFDMNTFAKNARVMFDGFDGYSKHWRDWAETPISDNRAKLLVGYFPKRLQGYVESRLDENLDGTKWGFYNAGTAAISHDFSANRSTNTESKKIKLGCDLTKMMSKSWYWNASDSEIKEDQLRKNKIKSVVDESGLFVDEDSDVIDVEFKVND